MAKWTKQERADAIERLHEILRPGDTIQVVLQHVSQSGMLRVINAYLIIPRKYKRRKVDILWLGRSIAAALDWPFDEKKEGVRVDGCGMDMGFHLIYSLAQVLFGDGYKLEHHWL